MEYNNLESEITSMMASAQFGLPGKEEDRTGPLAKPRTLGAGWILYGFVRAMRPQTILEIGTGGSTACLLWGLKHNGMGHLHTCDVFATGLTDDQHLDNFISEPDGSMMNHNKADVVRMIRKWEMEDICTIHHKSSINLLPEWDMPVDMVVVDGDHSLEYLKNDVQFLRYLVPGGYGFFHDFLACLYEVGATVRDWVSQSDEWSLIVEPNCLSLGIVQRKFSLDPKACFAAIRLTRADNPNGARTPIQFTDPRACGAIQGWTGAWFPATDFHKDEAEGFAIGEKIMEYERVTGTVVQSMEDWECQQLR